MCLMSVCVHTCTGTINYLFTHLCTVSSVDRCQQYSPSNTEILSPLTVQSASGLLTVLMDGWYFPGPGTCFLSLIACDMKFNVLDALNLPPPPLSKKSCVLPGLYFCPGISLLLLTAIVMKSGVWASLNLPPPVAMDVGTTYWLGPGVLLAFKMHCSKLDLVFASLNFTPLFRLPTFPILYLPGPGTSLLAWMAKSMVSFVIDKLNLHAPADCKDRGSSQIPYLPGPGTDLLL